MNVERTQIVNETNAITLASDIFFRPNRFTSIVADVDVDEDLDLADDSEDDAVVVFEFVIVGDLLCIAILSSTLISLIFIWISNLMQT